MPRPSRASTLMIVYPGHSGVVTWGLRGFR